jgi:MFS family permease
MANVNPPIPLTTRHSGSISASDAAILGASSAHTAPDSASAPSLPPISRKKQAAVLFSAFMTIVLTIGYNQCFGVFQQYYLSPDQDILADTPSTAWLAFVGTLCYGLTWGGGILVNPVISRIEAGVWTPTTPSSRAWRRRILRLLTPKTITVLGVILMSVGFVLASFSHELWQLLLTQGLMVGLGMSLLYFPLLAPAPEYFTNHRATAMGFVSASQRPLKLLLRGSHNVSPHRF